MSKATMDVDEIMESLEVLSALFPYDAVEAAIEQRDEIAPRLVRVLEETAENAYQRAHQEPAYMAHLFAMFLLAEFREPRAYGPLIALIRLPGDLPELLFGDALTECMSKALASVWGGDPEPLKTLIEDEAAYEYSRMAGLGAIVTLVCVGELARETAIAYFRELFEFRLRAPESVWGDLVGSACDLHPGELYPQIEQAYSHDLVDEVMVTLDEVRRDRRLSVEEALAMTRRNHHHQLISDTVAEMEEWACFEPENEFDDTEESSPDWVESGDEGDRQPIRRLQPKVGRNEPCPCGSGKKFKKCCGK